MLTQLSEKYQRCVTMHAGSILVIMVCRALRQRVLPMNHNNHIRSSHSLTCKLVTVVYVSVSHLFQVQTRGCTVLLLEVCRLLGLSECALSSPSEDILLRILTPLLKLYTAKQVSESYILNAGVIVYFVPPHNVPPQCRESPLGGNIL